MCGIAGILNLDRQNRASEVVLEQMLQSIYHRGPDDEGTLIDHELAMGMRRLSIIDLAEGKQPIFDESGRYGVVFNGEIYNYRELRSELISRGHVLKTHSDTEVIVHLYEEMGPACLDHLRGMFAIAVWDAKERTLFLARDRLGIKPLYYTIAKGRFLFGSEIKAILKDPEIDARLNHAGLSHFLSLKFVPAPATLFEGIQSLPPGHSIFLHDGQVDISEYWNVSFVKPSQQRSEEDYAEEALELLRESVKLRLRSDVPFGAFLSGGVDSSTIVALMSEQMTEPVKTFSVGFGPGDELPYAKIVADRFECEHYTLKATAEDFLKYAENVLWHMDQPIADQATVATFMVARLAREHVKMVLTGEGGDELFAGYARYAGERYSPWFKALPSWGGKAVRTLVRQLPQLRRSKIAINALTIRDEATRFANWFPMFSDEAKEAVLGTAMQEHRSGAAAVFQQHLQQCDAVDPLDRMLYVDSKLWLPDYLLLRGDKLTMANSLEARVPLLDHKLVEFAARLPVDYKLRKGQRKYLLKRVAGKLIPDSIINRKKQGFPIPIERWLRKEARPLMRELLSEDCLRRRGLFDSKFVLGLVAKHEAGFGDFSTELWGLMSIEMWMQKYCDGIKTPQPSHSAPLIG